MLNKSVSNLVSYSTPKFASFVSGDIHPAQFLSHPENHIPSLLPGPSVWIGAHIYAILILTPPQKENITAIIAIAMAIPIKYGSAIIKSGIPTASPTTHIIVFAI